MPNKNLLQIKLSHIYKIPHIKGLDRVKVGILPRLELYSHAKSLQEPIKNATSRSLSCKQEVQATNKALNMQQSLRKNQAVNIYINHNLHMFTKL